MKWAYLTRIILEKFNDIIEGDTLEIFKMEEIKKSLDK